MQFLIQLEKSLNSGMLLSFGEYFNLHMSNILGKNTSGNQAASKIFQYML
jgi:hypothetical protein